MHPFSYRGVKIRFCEYIGMIQSYVANRKRAKEEGFVSDGCTVVPDFDICHCCELHDYLYYRGGDTIKRARADKLLGMCIVRQGQRNHTPQRYNWLAVTYWLGVRIFGWLAFNRRKHLNTIKSQVVTIMSYVGLK